MRAARASWLSGVGELTSPFFFSRPPLTVSAVGPRELRFPFPDGLRPSGSSSSSAASRLNSGSTSCSAHRGATAVRTKHAIGLVYQIENDLFSFWQCQYRKQFSGAQEAGSNEFSYPQACTFFTFPQRSYSLMSRRGSNIQFTLCPLRRSAPLSLAGPPCQTSQLQAALRPPITLRI